MNRLQDKIALITGGTSGMGAATASLFQQEGARVIATGSSAASVEAARDAMPGIEFIHSDSGNVVETKALIDHVIGVYGRIDTLFVNAGIARVASIEKTEEAMFDQVMGVNFRGPYFLIKHASTALATGGSVILTSSLAAVRGITGLTAYGASKAALHSLGLSLAVELAVRKIRVNTLIPGPIQTNLGSKMEMTPDQAAHSGNFMERVLLDRVGQEIAAAALYFASDDSRFTTGAQLVIDGGYTAA